MTSATRALVIRVPHNGTVGALATRPRITEAALVLAHGAGAGMGHPFMAAVAEGLAERRVATLRYQFPYMEAGRRRVDAAPLAHATVRAATARARALWADVPLFAGGKSFGGRMTSQAQSIEPLPGVDGLLFLGFPLHPAGKPSVDRAAHLSAVGLPMLFVHGSRDALAEPLYFRRTVKGIGPLASCVEVAEADHGFHVPRRTGLGDAEILDAVLDAVAVWMQAWRIG
ncbi:MAG: alpha/beta hydrolase [Comamonadaceae bacterium]|nr:MAG: alpha/beta hydrolase [Comamonadaceae bacterium]